MTNKSDPKLPLVSDEPELQIVTPTPEPEHPGKRIIELGILPEVVKLPSFRIVRIKKTDWN